jgi:hypothetical protein
MGEVATMEAPVNAGRIRMVSLSPLLAGGAAVVSLAAMLRIWQVFSGQQAMWPLPALYLLEMVALPAAACAALIRRSDLGTAAAWGAAGATAGFAGMGAWSIGLAYVPIALLLSGAGVLALAGGRKPLLPHLVIAAITAGVQVAVMLAVVGLM